MRTPLGFSKPEQSCIVVTGSWRCSSTSNKAIASKDPGLKFCRSIGPQRTSTPHVFLPNSTNQGLSSRQDRAARGAKRLHGAQPMQGSFRKILPHASEYLGLSQVRNQMLFVVASTIKIGLTVRNISQVGIRDAGSNQGSAFRAFLIVR